MENNIQTPIILGRPFLATAVTLIDVKNDRLTLTLGEEKCNDEEIERTTSTSTKVIGHSTCSDFKGHGCFKANPGAQFVAHKHLQHRDTVHGYDGDEENE
ncbi:hypothetical protein ACLOJK_022427 [Asimina triloba]